jgi:dTMP kinase
VILDKLNNGTNILLDRYSYSGIAFSAAKGLDPSWCKYPDIGLPEPDYIFFLDLPVDEMQRRGGFGEERYEKLEFQAKVRQVFHSIKEPWWTVTFLE